MLKVEIFGFENMSWGQGGVPVETFGVGVENIRRNKRTTGDGVGTTQLTPAQFGGNTTPKIWTFSFLSFNRKLKACNAHSVY